MAAQAKVREMPRPATALPSIPEPSPEFVAVADAVALKAWRYWQLELLARGWSSRIDSLSLGGACLAYARAIRAEGFAKDNPADWRAPVAADRAWKRVFDFCASAGLTLASGQQAESRQMQLGWERDNATILGRE